MAIVEKSRSEIAFRDAQWVLLDQRWTVEEARKLTNLVWCGVDFSSRPDISAEVEWPSGRIIIRSGPAARSQARDGTLPDGSLPSPGKRE